VTFGLEGLDMPKSEDYEGRVITAEYEQFVLVHCYIPNSGQNLERLEYRTKQWDPAMLQHLKNLEEELKKPVVWCGDLNVAHLDIDVHDPKGNVIFELFIFRD
jgi:exodeoxyribonuclease III